LIDRLPTERPFIVPETLNALWNIAPRVAREVSIVSARPGAARAAELSEILDHPLYDCLYLALAESRDDVLTTHDRKFVQSRSVWRDVHPKLPTEPVNASLLWSAKL